MIEQLVTLVTDESRWMMLSLISAFLVTLFKSYRYRGSDFPLQSRLLTFMNLFFGMTVGTMAFGHTLAVSVKYFLNILDGNIILLYGIGVFLIAPSWWLVYHSRHLLDYNNSSKKTLILNIWMLITLLALGIHNLPLAIPAFLNIAYQLHSRRVAGRLILAITVIFYIGLFIGSVIFFVSGQSFEQFQGIE